MPIYEYRCGKCGFQKEFLQRLNDAPLTQCPECGKRALSKMVTAAGFQLKGTGWYATDFKSSGAKPVAKPDQADGKHDKAEAKQDKAETRQDKPAAAEKPAAGSGKESSKAAPAAAEAPAARAADASAN